MNVYDLNPVTDNPLFEGLSLGQPASQLLRTWPRDWAKHPLSWEAKSLAPNWHIREVKGNVRLFNDYPCINLTHPAFSQRAVDMLRDLLEPNGELLPVRHELGTYFFFNCTRSVNVIDLSRSKVNHGLADIGSVVFLVEAVNDFGVFRDRSLPANLLCTQAFVDRVEATGLHGFVFIPLWPLGPGITYHSERYRLCKLAEKWKPNPWQALEIKGNTVVLRLRCQGKKPMKDEVAAANAVMVHLQKALYDSNQSQPEDYFGNVEGSDVVEFEIRVFISTPDSDRLLNHIVPSLKKLPWPGRFYVVKRRCNFMDGQAVEEYISLSK